MNAADIIGYVHDGTLFCNNHRPEGRDGHPEVSPLLSADGHVGDACDVCEEYLAGCEPDADALDMVEACVEACAKLRDILWPGGNADADWSPDTLEAVAAALDFLRPEGK